MEFINLDGRYTMVYSYHFFILNHFRYKEKISIPYYLLCALNVGIMDVISNPKTNLAMHEGLMVVLYNHIKNNTAQLNIVEVSKSNEELDDLDDDDGEGYNKKANVEEDPHILGSSKRKRKTGQEDQGKGSAKRKQNGEDDDSWYEEEDETEEDMETNNEEVQILSSQKEKGKILRGEDL